MGPMVGVDVDSVYGAPVGIPVDGGEVDTTPVGPMEGADVGPSVGIWVGEDVETSPVGPMVGVDVDSVYGAPVGIAVVGEEVDSGGVVGLAVSHSATKDKLASKQTLLLAFPCTFTCFSPHTVK